MPTNPGSVAVKAARILDYRASVNKGCHRPTTANKNHWFPPQTLELEGLLGKHFLAAKHLRALGKGIILVLMSPVSLLGSRRDAGMDLQGWAMELIPSPSLFSQSALPATPRWE